MAMGMGIQPTATPPTATTPPTMATLTLTVHDITDIGGILPAILGLSPCLLCPALWLGLSTRLLCPALWLGLSTRLLCATVRLGISPGILAVAVGTQAPAAYLTTCAGHRRPRPSSLRRGRNSASAGISAPIDRTRPCNVVGWSDLHDHDLRNAISLHC